MTQVHDLGRRLITGGLEIIRDEVTGEGRQRLQSLGDDATKQQFLTTGLEIDVVLSGLNFIIDGGGSAITTGIKGDIMMPFGGDITLVTLLADQSGSIKVDIWKKPYWTELFVTAGFPPTNSDTITGGDEPEISSTTSWSSAGTNELHLRDWTRGVAEGDVLRVNVDSITTITRCTLAIRFTHDVEVTKVQSSVGF